MSVLRVTADLSSLPAVQEYVLANARQAALPDGTKLKLDLVIEEVLVNIANHAYQGGDGFLEVECTVKDKAFCCLLRDWGPPFNPLEADTPDVNKSIEDRPIGGLGIFLTTTMADDCSYKRHDNANELTFCFSLH